MSYDKQFIVKPGSKVDLSKIDAGFKDKHESHEDALPVIEKNRQRLSDLQFRLFAEAKQSLLICLQALDGAGKGWTVNHVLSAMNPQGSRVYGFKQPLAEELAHDLIFGASTKQRRPRAESRSSTARTTRMFWWCVSMTSYPSRSGRNATT